MQIKPVGINGILCVMGDQIDPLTGAAIASLEEVVRRAQIPGLIELVPAFTSLMVRFDPAVTDYRQVSSYVTAAQKTIENAKSGSGRIVDIPVCYGGEYGPDLSYVAEHAGMTEQEVIEIHAGNVYPIYMLGFLPGFPYLGGMDQRLFTPRLASPRKSIPAGSVGIGGQQTGIYPMESPGGWQLIGRTPLKLFDPAQPLPYHTGDSIRFVPISEDEFRREQEKWQSK